MTLTASRGSYKIVPGGSTIGRGGEYRPRVSISPHTSTHTLNECKLGVSDGPAVDVREMDDTDDGRPGSQRL